ncbi:MAG: hypothetical protein K2X27_16915 [Candidatus Obscuribacterales bacterium]|nr:hypothetical protein [Candidatus Obscuribacterales bacterium]
MTAGIFSNSGAKPYPWLFHPLVDLFFCCGGLFWLLVALHFKFNAPGQALNQSLPYETVLLLAGSVLFSNPHVSATLLRLYSKKETRNRLWFHSYLSLIFFTLLVGASLSNTFLLALLIRLYASLTFDHTISQNYGITLMYCYRSGFLLENKERLCLKVIHHSLTWFSILRQFTYIEFCPKKHLGFTIPMLGPIPEIFTWTALSVLILSSICFLAILARKAVKEGRHMPLPAYFLLFTSVIMFTAGVEISGGFFLFTPAFFHAAQYLVVATYYNLKESGQTENVRPENMIRLLFSGANLKYYFGLLGLGTMVFALAPFAISLFGVSFTAAWAAIFVCGGFHHFLADSALWKLRDARVREAILN